MKVRIITDSSADLAQEVRARVTVLPLTVRFGDTDYLDGVTISHTEFYELLAESDTVPTTSQIPPQIFADAYRNAIDAGEKVLAITLSSKLSGTYQSAVIAAADYPGDVYVIESKNVAIGTGILIEHALFLLDSGMSLSDTAQTLLALRDRVCLIAMVDTLEYLKRGGRLSKTAAFAGGLLSIKPVIGIEDGEIKILGKARGSRQANNMLTEQIRQGGIDYSMPILLGYTGTSDSLLMKYVEDSSAIWKNHIGNLNHTTIGSAIGTHAGPGAVAVAFFRKK